MLLLKHGADRKMRNKAGELPSDVAGSSEVVEILTSKTILEKLKAKGIKSDIIFPFYWDNLQTKKFFSVKFKQPIM